MKTSTIGILGIGRLGECLARYVLTLPATETLLVTNRSASRVVSLKRFDDRVQEATPEEMLQQCDIVIVSLNNQATRDLLPRLNFEGRHHLLSMVAEARFCELENLTRDKTASISRVLALPSVAEGGQVVPVFPDTEAAQAVFGQRNTLLGAKSETELLSFWTVTGALSSTMLLGAVSTHWLQNKGITRAAADDYVRAMYAEVNALLKDGFAEGMTHVSTPGGLNQQMLGQLCDAGIDTEMTNSLTGIYERISNGLK